MPERVIESQPMEYLLYEFELSAGDRDAGFPDDERGEADGIDEDGDVAEIVPLAPVVLATLATAEHHFTALPERRGSRPGRRSRRRGG
jgi:hypothetical protein